MRQMEGSDWSESGLIVEQMEGSDWSEGGTKCAANEGF